MRQLTYKGGTITELTQRYGGIRYLYDYRNSSGITYTIRDAKRLISHYRKKHKDNQQQELTC